MSTPPLPVLTGLAPPVARKAPVALSTLSHRDLRRGPWWRKIPAYADVDEATFLDHAWQAKSSITRVSKLVETIQGLVPGGFTEDLERGMRHAPMSVRVSPYIVSLIDWEHAYDDPLRVQFFPVASRLLADHPKLGLDSLAEQADAVWQRVPQRLINVARDDYDDAAVRSMFEEIRKDYGIEIDDVRFLIRPSGTEPVVRVMIEALDEDFVNDFSQRIQNFFVA